jgi:hypothetical protein
MGGSTNGSELVDDLGTIASFLHHALHAPCLPFNSSQPGEHFLLHFFWKRHFFHSTAPCVSGT